MKTLRIITSYMKFAFSFRLSATHFRNDLIEFILLKRGNKELTFIIFLNKHAKS